MMSDRERWIVYPLLTLSLAVGLKQAFFAALGDSKFNTVSCHSLVVLNGLNQPQAVFQVNDQGSAELSLSGDDGSGDDGDKAIAASLLADDGGGRLILVRRSDGRAIVLGHDQLEEISGLWAVDREAPGSKFVPISASPDENGVWKLLPWPIAATPEKPQTESPVKSAPKKKPAP